MTYSDQILLAYRLGATCQYGYWKFPTVEAKEQFEREVAAATDDKDTDHEG